MIGTGDLEYDWDGRNLLRCSSSGNQKTMVSSNDENSIFSGARDPHLPGEIRGHLVACPSQVDCYYTGGLLESQGVSNMSNLAQYPTNSVNIESVTDVPCTSGASFAGPVGLFPMAGYCQSSSHPAQDVKKTKDVLNSQKCFNSCKRAREEEHVEDEDTSELSPHGKRQGTVYSTTTNCQPGQCKADDILEKKDERKDKSEQNTTAAVHSQTIEKESKPAQKASAQKDARAKRGQATSAHSLAERVRRERINERMKFLQDLVPGCDKVTGKAVMLDEIINYVQSLQRQVEFLSMKLATVYPEMKIDIEKLLYQDIHRSQDGIAALPGSGPAVTSTYSVFPVDIHGQIYNSNLQQSPGVLMPSVWHQGQINLNQICSFSNPALGNPEPSGSHFE